MEVTLDGAHPQRVHWTISWKSMFVAVNPRLNRSYRLEYWNRNTVLGPKRHLHRQSRQLLQRGYKLGPTIEVGKLFMYAYDVQGGIHRALLKDGSCLYYTRRPRYQSRDSRDSRATTNDHEGLEATYPDMMGRRICCSAPCQVLRDCLTA